jgi:2-succinyl-5-enolpyruvyl-6-hydroxy-3-cyclohexene-1-carboxylate synthase
LSQTAELGYRWAWALLDGLAAAGLRRVVASPGSRSTPITLAALRHPDLQVHMIVDERSAAFVALGLTKAERVPAALIATSGSAVANWLPAVVEADMARAPLILLSADRPPELQDCGANQTMDQTGLFGGHVRAFHQLPPPEADTGWLAGFSARAMAASRAPLAGPVHINLPLREPLTPTGTLLPSRPAPAPKWLPGKLQLDAGALANVETLLAGNGAIVCGSEDFGADFRLAVTELAKPARAPIFADILSGLRFSAHRQEAILAHPDQVARNAPLFDWALRFGGAPVCKATSDWLQRNVGATQIVVSAHERFADPGRTATHLINTDPTLLCQTLIGQAAPSGWLERFSHLDKAASVAAEKICDGEQPFEGALLRRLVRALPEQTPLFLANSLTIRSAEWFGGRTANALRCFGNRGLSGIDGNLSTAFGIAAAYGQCVAVVGDLAFLHDLNALALAQRFSLTLLLLDNGGGGIFDHLAQASLPEFPEAWLTQTTFDAEAIASGFGVSFFRAQSVDDAVAATIAGLAKGGSSIVHVRIDRGFSLDRCQSFFAACQQEFSP